MATTTAAPELSRIVIAPLTTVFTPVPSCSVLTYQFPSVWTEYTWYVDLADQWWPATGCGGTQLECLPGQTTWDLAVVNHFYSPGLYCPSGWTTATQMANEPGSTSVLGIVAETLLPGETAAICCPSNYVFAPPDLSYTFGRCSSEVTTGTQAYLVCDENTMTTVTVAQTTSVSWDSTSWYYRGIEIAHPMLQINWQSSDRVGHPANTNAQPNLASATGGPDGSEPTTSTQPGGGEGNQQHAQTANGPTVLAVGLGVGVSLGLCVVAMAIFMFWRMRRWKQQSCQMHHSHVFEADGGDYVFRNKPASGAEVELAGSLGGLQSELDGDGSPVSPSETRSVYMPQSREEDGNVKIQRYTAQRWG